MHDLRRKLLSLGNHFFERLKTANFSTACGTVTLKSPPSRAFAAPHVHPRPRKRPPRCTLDCGFKTSESPALRGFEAGPRALATAALYLVLLSNGLHHSENLPVKFGFSLKIVPATIAKKLPLQLRPKPFFIAFFSLSHKRPTFAFTGESGYTTRPCSKDRTQGHTRRNTGPSLPQPQCGLVLPAISLLFHHAFIYIHFPVLCEPSTPAEEKNLSKLLP